ncbi:aminotransferase class I/II-fold pyridoxal phosphate-dependent enzyme [Micromonospora echinospora]
MRPPPPAGADDLALIDVPFSLPQFGRADDFRAVLHRKMTAYPRWLLCMTPSKDLSIPGLRVGFVAGTEPGFVEFAAAVRFERGYSVNAAVALVAAVHLGLLLLALAAPADRERTAARLREMFDRHGVPFLDHEEQAAFLAEMGAATAHFARNIDLLDGAGPFAPLSGAARPVAGCSTFRWLTRPFAAPDAWTRWVNQLGHAGLKVNLVTAERTGWVRAVDARAIGTVARRLGAGRQVKNAPIDHAVGVTLHQRVGGRVAAGEPLAQVHHRGTGPVPVDRVRDAFTVVPERVPSASAVHGVLRPPR